MNKYCILPFISVRVEDSVNLKSMRFRPCCLYNPETPITFNNVQEYLESSFLKGLQQHLLTQPELPKGCQKCANIEKKNLISVRKHNFNYFDKTVLTSTDIKHLDLFPSNTCNINCIMCSPKFSSSVGAEQKKLNLIQNLSNFDVSDLVCDTLSNFDNIEYINLAGGEFFYSKHCNKILNEIIKKKHIKAVQIISNGTVCKPEHLELLRQIPNLKLRFSLEGTSNIYNFVRYPANWSEVSANVINYKDQLPDAKIESVIIMMPLTIFDIFNYFDFCNQNSIHTETHELTGEAFGWQMLTLEEKQIVIKFVLKEINQHQLTSNQKITLLNYIKSVIPNVAYDPEQRRQAIEKISTLCRLRNQNTDEIFSELPDLRNELLRAINI